MESLSKLREPAAVVLLVVLAVRVVMALVAAVVYLQGEFGGLPSLAGLLSYRASDPILVVATAAVVASCVLTRPTPRVREIATAALVVVGVSLVVALVFALVGLGSGDAAGLVSTVDQLATLALPVLALVVIVRVRQLLPAAGSADPYAVAAAAQPALPQLPAPVDEQYQPSWLPDTASGAAWHRAGDAASGAPASGWGTPGQAGGWQVDPTQVPYTPQPIQGSQPTQGPQPTQGSQPTQGPQATQGSHPTQGPQPTQPPQPGSNTGSWPPDPASDQGGWGRTATPRNDWDRPRS